MKNMAAVLDIGTSKMAMVLASKAGPDELEVLGQGVCDYPGFRNGLWTDASSVPDAIRVAKEETENTSGRRIREVYVSVPGEFSQLEFRYAEVPVHGKNGCVSKEDLHRVVSEASDFPIPAGMEPLYRIPVLYTLDGTVSKEAPRGLQGETLGLYITLLLGNSGYMDHMQSMLQKLGMEVVDFLPSPSSLAMWAAKNYALEKGSTVILDSGHSSTDIIVIEGGNAVYHKVIPVGGFQITSDLSAVMDLQTSEADAVKKKCMIGLNVPQGDSVIVDTPNGVKHVDMDTAQQVIEARVEDTVRRILKELREFGLTPNTQTVFLLAGDGLKGVTGAREYISHLIGTTVRDFTAQDPDLAEAGQLTAEALLWQIMGNDKESNDNPIKAFIQKIKGFIKTKGE